MSRSKSPQESSPVGGALVKSRTGISGLDEITFGGLPTRRTSLVLGSPGCGKTILGLQFLLNGIELGEHGVLVTLDQLREHVIGDARSIGLDLEAAEERGELAVLSIDLLRNDAIEAGAFTLDGFLASVARVAKSISACRLVIDGIDDVFASFSDPRFIRNEFRRLAQRFSEFGLTTVLTGSGPGSEHRMEEYLSDCVLLLDHRVNEQISTRRLRVLKYRGTEHGTDEYPFAITSHGLQVFPITSTTLDYPASRDTMSTGVDDLDLVLGGPGIFKGSAMLLAGQAGTGKTSIACRLAVTAGMSGRRCAYFAFEESQQQLHRNMGSIGLDIDRATDEGCLEVYARRPSFQGLEQHLDRIQRTVGEVAPDVVVIDPVTNLVSVGSGFEVKAMITRMLDWFKTRQISVVLTSLILSGDDTFGADIGISSLMDTIVLLQHELVGNRRRRTLSILKSRGMASSQEVSELVFSADGIRLLRPAQPDGDPS